MNLNIAMKKNTQILKKRIKFKQILNTIVMNLNIAMKKNTQILKMNQSNTNIKFRIEQNDLRLWKKKI